MINSFVYNLKNSIQHKKSERIQELKNKETMATTLCVINQHVQNFLEWDNDDRTVPCLNLDCEWFDLFHTFYSKIMTFWPLPADPQHSQGYCRVCQGFKEKKILMTQVKIKKQFLVEIPI